MLIKIKLKLEKKVTFTFPTVIQGDSDVFSIKRNLNSLYQGERRFSHAFFTKVLHFRDNRKNVQFSQNLKFELLLI